MIMMWACQENYRLQEVTETCQEVACEQIVKPNFTQMKYKVLMSELASGWILWSEPGLQFPSAFNPMLSQQTDMRLV